MYAALGLIYYLLPGIFILTVACIAINCIQVMTILWKAGHTIMCDTFQPLPSTRLSLNIFGFFKTKFAIKQPKVEI